MWHAEAADVVVDREGLLADVAGLLAHEAVELLAVDKGRGAQAQVNSVNDAVIELVLRIADLLVGLCKCNAHLRLGKWKEVSNVGFDIVHTELLFKGLFQLLAVFDCPEVLFKDLPLGLLGIVTVAGKLELQVGHQGFDCFSDVLRRKFAVSDVNDLAIDDFVHVVLSNWLDDQAPVDDPVIRCGIFELNLLFLRELRFILLLLFSCHWDGLHFPWCHAVVCLQSKPLIKVLCLQKELVECVYVRL